MNNVLISNIEQDERLTTPANLFCPEYDSLKVISNTRNTVVEINKESESIILKIKDANTPYGRMTNDEVDWIRYLHSNGIGVPCLILSVSNQYVEQAGSSESKLIAYCYKKFPIDNDEKKYGDTIPFIQALGSTMGKMHTLAESYQTPETENLPAWDIAAWLQDPEGYFHPSQSGVCETIHRIKNQVSGLPKSMGTYGVIHNDLHSGNVFRIASNIVIIDFECLQTNWFLAEIASTFLFKTWIGPEKDQPRRISIPKPFLPFCQMLKHYGGRTNIPA